MNKIKEIAEKGVIVCDTFSKSYPIINNAVLSYGERQSSRNGNVYEILDFKTKITNPYRRCVGGYDRGMNVFFLLAEALWIFSGRKDVEFLNIFNGQMKEYSDDGLVFHAPYGFRLRHWGVRSEDKYTSENMHAAQGFDQVLDAIRLLDNDKDSRRVVMSIWNPDFDLSVESKDLPCNDLVMLKIRNGKLITTIQNRSNDLHWGLPTNVFQFSFLTELISLVLGVELGTQTHNSQSLHVYDWHEIAVKMDKIYTFDDESSCSELYFNGAVERKIDFKFINEVVGNRLREVDQIVNLIVDNLTSVYLGNGDEQSRMNDLKFISSISKYLGDVYLLLETYILYKKKIVGSSVLEKDKIRVDCILDINKLIESDPNWDVKKLALNFFESKLINKKVKLYL